MRIRFISGTPLCGAERPFFAQYLYFGFEGNATLRGHCGTDMGNQRSDIGTGRPAAIDDVIGVTLCDHSSPDRVSFESCSFD